MHGLEMTRFISDLQCYVRKNALILENNLGETRKELINKMFERCLFQVNVCEYYVCIMHIKKPFLINCMPALECDL